MQMPRFFLCVAFVLQCFLLKQLLRPSSESLRDDTVVEEFAYLFSSPFRVSSSEKVSSSFFFDRELLSKNRAA